MLLVLVIALQGSPLFGASSPLPTATPLAATMDERHLEKIDEVVAEGLRDKKMPGCVVAVGRRGKIVFQEAYGYRQSEPERIPMTLDTVFDLASLTKPIATATSVMMLWESGKLRLCDPVAEHLPEFGQNGKEPITILELLTHQGGLIPDNPLADYREAPEVAWSKIFALKPRAPAGSRFIYSDVGYLVLGEVVRRVSGKDLHEFTSEKIFRPLGMNETGFLPRETLRRRAAPTEKRNERWMRGEVHDPRAHLLGGVTGHAGLFSTASDLAVFAQMMLDRGTYGSVRLLEPHTVNTMTRSYRVSSGFRGLGWDSKSGYSSNRGRTFSVRAYGHGGFTGTAMWIDPELDLFVIFLSNRLHPDGKGSVNALAGEIATIAADAIRDYQPPSVLTGIDILRRDEFAQLSGSKVGLITNHTGVDREGITTIRRFRDAENVELVALFSPEHGLAGKLDQHISNSRDLKSGLPVYSLYGKTRRPTSEMLAGIDTLVYDIQDVGTRFYTYISTMGLAMESAAHHEIRFVVLDRPNPIGGVAVEGPMLDLGRESFTGYHQLPVRHGMTVGELAAMLKAERNLDVDLEVVRVEGWQRAAFFDATGLRWVNPSPNMRSLAEAILYPGVGLLERTNISVGRGTDVPFEIIGAPWIDGTQLQRALDEAGLEGVQFQATVFTPNESKFRNERCEGVTITVTDRDTFRPLAAGLEIARQLRTLYPDVWNAEAYDVLLVNKAVHTAVLTGKSIEQIESIYRPDLENFLRKRSRFLLYSN